MPRLSLPRRRSSRASRPPLPDPPTSQALDEYIKNHVPWVEKHVPLQPEKALVGAALDVVRTLSLFDADVWTAGHGPAAEQDLQETAESSSSGKWHDLRIRADLPKDGITNSLVRVWVDGDEEGAVLVRAYGSGTDKVIDRKQEMRNLLLLSANSLAPPLHGRFQNGLVYGYVSGRVTTVGELQDPIISSLIAKCVAKLHNVTVGNVEGPPCEQNGSSANGVSERIPHGGGQLFQTLHRWISALHHEHTFPNPVDQDKFDREVNLDQIERQVTDLLPRITKLESPVVFSHNDLLSGNFIFDSTINDAKSAQGRVTVIDYEYACAAPRGFDIGNHFNEMMGFDLDPKKWPSREVQMRWCEVYHDEWMNLNPSTDPGLEDRAERIYQEANAYSLLSHLYWGLWALIQAQISSIDFPYMQYAVDRFRFFRELREERLRLAGCDL